MSERGVCMEILIISGLSGAGKSKAASFLEDMGFYIVDNMPAAMILKFAEFCTVSNGRYDRVALVYDVRTANSFTEFFEVLDKLKAMDSQSRMLFLEASPETVLKRYKETRRRHPLRDGADSLEEAVRQERALMQPVKDRADYVVDTSRLSTAQLRSELLRLFDTRGEKAGMTVNVTSFGFKYGLPLESDLVFDVRCLPNPFYVEELREHTGLEAPVRDYVMNCKETEGFKTRFTDMIDYMLPLYIQEGKSQLVIAVGCTGGHHRSVALAQYMHDHLAANGVHATVSHRDITKQ